MTLYYHCDQCTYQQQTPLSFQVVQITDEIDDDGQPLTVELHICTAQCLSDFAMGLSLDYPDNDS